MEELEIGQRLQELRKHRGFTQEYVAKKLFISQSAYSMVESSNHSLNTVHIIRLCNLLNVSADYLLLGTKNLIEMSIKNNFIPLFNTIAHAGILKKAAKKENFSNEVEFYRIPGFNPTAETVLIEIEGKSMEPTVMGGDILICQRQNHFEHILDGSLAILATNEDFLLKRIRIDSDEDYLWVESDNLEEPNKKKIYKKNILSLYMVKGKVSHILIPRYELAFKGKIQDLEESINFLKQEIYKFSKK